MVMSTSETQNAILAEPLCRTTSSPKESEKIAPESATDHRHAKTAASPPEQQKQKQQQEAPAPEPPEPDEPYTVLHEREKIFTILMASFAAFISPVSASAYYPALNSLSRDLHVSVSTINLTITVYMVFQGLAPAFIGNFSDKNGRRPAYLICFVIYIGANIGLALQDSYAALVVLRCLQSSGSSGTVALGSAVVADVVTRAERGKYIGYASMGITLGPALGPIIGGLLAQFLGWRSIFWFLTIFSGSMMVLILLLFPETCRSVVGNGSVAPQKWNVSALSMIRKRRRGKAAIMEENETITRRRRRVNPFEALLVLREKEADLILFFGALLSAGFLSVLSSLPSQLQEKYGFDALQVGLCFLPYGFGSMTSRWTVGTLVDRNFKRHAKRLGIEIVKNRQPKLDNFPLEKARLQITMPLVYAGCVSITTYSWVMHYKTNLAGPLVTLFFTGHTVTGAFSSLNTLVVDSHKENPATAVAANNLVRCLFGAGAVAAVVPLIERIGMGWTGTLVAAIWLVFSPCLWAVFMWGQGWREKKRREETKEDAEQGTKGKTADREAANSEKVNPPVVSNQNPV